MIPSNMLTGDFLSWAILRHLEEWGLQIFVKIDLKCSTYGPEHKTERFRTIEVIVNFWELLEVGKIFVF
jgi:hypothetical protein